MNGTRENYKCAGYVKDEWRRETEIERKRRECDVPNPHWYGREDVPDTKKTRPY
jgi:hypothetical protein